MEKFVKGDIVVVPFPFSDLTISKKRPCLTVAKLKGNDIILCQITSQSREDQDAIELKRKDFQEGSLDIDSWIRPNKLFTSELSIVQYKAGELKPEKIKQVEEQLCKIFKRWLLILKQELEDIKKQIQEIIENGVIVSNNTENDSGITDDEVNNGSELVEEPTFNLFKAIMSLFK